MKEKEKRIEILRKQRQMDAMEETEKQMTRKFEMEGILNLKIKELR